MALTDREEEVLGKLQELKKHPGWPEFLELLSKKGQDVDDDWLDGKVDHECARGKRSAWAGCGSILNIEVKRLEEKQSGDEEED